MTQQVNGELVPIGGGDPIPLIRPLLVVGRRESCDICMHYPNISGQHCELTFRDGFWFIRDLNSTNGVKVNGARVQEKRLHPKDEVVIGKRSYTIEYELPAGANLREETEENIFGQSLLERAGLEKPKSPRDPKKGKAKSADPADFLLDDDE